MDDPLTPAPGTDPTALRADLASIRVAPEWPKAFNIGDELQRNVMGKLSDWPLDVAHSAAQL